MLRIIRNFDYGDNQHTVYLAERAGDALPLHKHDDRGHLTICMSGEIEAFFPDRDSVVAKPGDAPFEFAVGRLHGIRAKSSGALFMSVASALPRSG